MSRLLEELRALDPFGVLISAQNAATSLIESAPTRSPCVSLLLIAMRWLTMCSPAAGSIQSNTPRLHIGYAYLVLC